jgi:hypothetical protein
MYEAPKLEKFGTFRELTLDRWSAMGPGGQTHCGYPGKNTSIQDPCLPLGIGTNDGTRS